MAASVIEIIDEEWELVNDDGFVYKRKKRPRLESTADVASASAPPPPDPAVEEKNRRQRKKMALLKLREKYQQEILQWEQLSNRLNEVQQKSPILQKHKSAESNEVSASSSPQPETLPGSSGRQLVDELLSLAEAQEAIIEDLSNLCDIAEGLCSKREEEMKKKFTELPIWKSSPRELIVSLCQD
ncbi:OLC1v1011279C1 [Oldenlandia corymbosa var. corymbosa]|uniref:OLC1v1011279C1 n=1 Tax=Oldenlandia corymbosa var. corymbosa TaxID=529605 RepID=A0AAV1DV04_OLDCO|nr:OLC1v1011279C1 [Oldenlandia corymbosa var. corymbosa]